MIINHTIGQIFSRTLNLNKDISSSALNGNILYNGNRYPLVFDVQDAKRGIIIISCKYIDSFKVGSYKYSIGYNKGLLDSGVINLVQTGGGTTIDTVSINNAISVLEDSVSSLDIRVSILEAAPPGGGSITSLEYLSLVNRVSANSAVGGGGSVTSNEVSIIDSRVSVLSDAISNEISNRVSVSAVLDAKISVLSAIVVTGLASVEAHASAASAAAAAVDGRATSLETRISTLSTAITPYYAFPTGLSVTAGVLVSGGFSALSAFGGEAVLISEVTSTVPFSLTIQLSAVSEIPNRLLIRAYYEGNAAHSVDVAIFNHTTSLWDNYGEIPADTELRYYEFNIFTGADHVSANNARVRIVHANGGTVTHSFQLDYLALVKMLAGAGITHHGALQGLDGDDHLLYALADGTRGFSALSDIVSALSALVVSGLASVDGHANTVSTRLVSVSAELVSLLASTSATLDAKISTLSARVVSGLASADARITSVAGLIPTVSVTSQEVSAQAVSIANVVSQNASLANVSLSAALRADYVSVANAVSVAVDAKVSALSTLFMGLSQTVSLMSTALSALEVRVSAISATVATSAAFNTRLNNISANWTYAGQVSVDKFSMVFLSAAATISASALAAVSGTTIQLSANSFYRVHGILAVNVAAVTSVKKYGLVFPAMNTCRGMMRASFSTTSTAQEVVGIIHEDCSNSAIIQSPSVGLSASLNVVMFEAIMYPSATGNMYWVWGAQATTGAAIAKVGSFIRTEKLR